MNDTQWKVTFQDVPVCHTQADPNIVCGDTAIIRVAPSSGGYEPQGCQAGVVRA